jgi:hypothetical protein
MACRPQSGSKATAFGTKSNHSDDVRFERLAGWLADTAAAPQIPDVFAAVPKGVSLVPRAAVSTCNNVAYRRGTYSITSSTGAGKEGGTVMSSARVLLAQRRELLMQVTV